MCVIISFPSAIKNSFPEEKIKNAVLNNPHGFGIVTVEDGKLDVRKFFDVKGSDPDKVLKEIEERKGADFFLHLRYATVGDKSIENTHPFTVYKGQDNCHIEFMHNGSLYKFKDTTKTDVSDTMGFAAGLLSPLLYKFQGDNGIADIEDPLLKRILDEYFSNTNRGLLISNKHSPLMLGTWSKFENNGISWAVSNNDYFNYAQTSRMTEYFKQKEATSKPVGNFPPPATAAANSNANAGWPFKETTSPVVTQANTERKVVALKDINIATPGRFLKPEDISDLFEGAPQEIDTETIFYISALSQLEIKNWLVANPEEAALLIEHLAFSFEQLSEDYETIAEKKEKGEMKIEALVKTVKDLEERVLVIDMIENGYAH